MSDSVGGSLARLAYHHGNLRAALVDAALTLTRSGGSAALVLREVTRQVGVSPNAAYRHFADREDLQRAVADEIQRRMAGQMEVVIEPGGDPREALRAVGLGYIRFALDEPGWFDVAFGATEPVPAVDLSAGGGPLPAPLARLVAALDRLVDAGELATADRVGAEWPCWSAVHGFAGLALYGPLRELPEPVVWRAAERTVDAVIAGVLQLSASGPAGRPAGSRPS